MPESNSNEKRSIHRINTALSTITPEVSFIVPIYNTPPKLIDRSIRSIASQGIASIEIIVVDDGSIKEISSYCDSLRDSYPFLRVIHQDNAGVSAARNSGLDLASGTWVMFVDADDELIPDTLEDALDTATRNNLDILYMTEITVNGNDSSERGLGFPVENKFRTVDNKEYLDELKTYFIAYESRDLDRIPKGLSVKVTCRLMKSCFAKSVRFDQNIRVMEDGAFNADLVSKVSRVGLLDKPCYYYYSNPFSITHTMDFESESESHCAAIAQHVQDLNLPQDAYYSNVCSYFFMACNSLLQSKKLSYKALRNGFNLPYFKVAFTHISNKYDYSSLFVKLKYYAASHGAVMFLYLLMRVRALL